MNNFKGFGTSIVSSSDLFLTKNREVSCEKELALFIENNQSS